MKYTKEQRLDIGRRIYYSEISRYEAAEEYGISEQTARNYMRMYRDANRLPPKHGQISIGALSFKKEPVLCLIFLVSCPIFVDKCNLNLLNP